jgi:hypothetical protein
MPTRQEVYAVIQDEHAYADWVWRDRCEEQGRYFTPDEQKPTEEWLVFIQGYHWEAVYNASHLGKEEALHSVRKMAALTMRCLMVCGGQYRGSDVFLEGLPLSFEQVCGLVDTERNYQDARFPSSASGPRHKITGYLVMFDTYLRRAIDGWTLGIGDRAALDNVRKLAGIAVRCLEEHGAPFRD